MKIIFSILIFLFVSAKPFAQYIERDLFTKRISVAEMNNMVKNLPGWREEKKKEVLEKLDKLSPKEKEQLVKNGEGYLDFAWPSLPAWNYLDFVRNGNRSVFQSKWSQRRAALNNLVVAELVEKKSRFIPQIINGIWALCEESTWCYPAHISAQGKAGLPDPNQQIIDLGAGETAIDLSWLYLMMKDSLQKISPIIPQRIQFELNKRIVQPYLTVDFWWMGFPRKKVNNWNIWVNRNCLYTIALTENNDTLAARSIERILKSADNFINSYGDDGGCEEGTHYWEEASGHMGEFIGLVKEISKGDIDVGRESIIKNMGQYIYKMHIDKEYFVDFADASPRPGLPPLVIFNYGKIIGDSVMMKFASYLAEEEHYSTTISRSDHLFDYFTGLFLRDQILQTTPKSPFIKESWFPDLQSVAVRDHSGNADGLFMAAKGGVNGVSHAHNDIGNFIIYVNGNPAIVDAGVGTYTAKTFSAQRYDIWTMQSSWHNLPSINGVQQAAGSRFRAEDVHFNSSKNKAVFELNIAAAYPEEAKVKSWKRSLTFNTNKNIVLKESYELTEYVAPTSLSMLTPLNVSVNGGEVTLKGISNLNKPYGLTIKYDPKKFTVNVEDKQMDDETLKRLWPQGLRRILFISKQKDLKGNFVIYFNKL